MRRHLMATVSILLLGALASPGSSQEPPDGPRDARALEGVWQGFDSLGQLLYVVTRTAGSDRLELSVNARGSGGRVADTLLSAQFRARDDEIAYLLAGDDTAVAVSFLGDQGIRLSWPDGREAILVRLLSEVPTGPMDVAGLELGFRPALQARLLTLEGLWYAHEPAELRGAGYELTVTDPVRGAVIWRAMGGGPPAGLADGAAGPVSGTIERLSVERLDMTLETGAQQTVTRSDDGHLTIAEGGRTLLVLGREPPE